MMAATAVIGISTGKRLLSSNFYCSDFVEKLACTSDQHQVLTSTKNVNVITARKSSNYGANHLSNRRPQSIRAVKEHVESNTGSNPCYTVEEPWPEGEESPDSDGLVDALLLLQKSMLEKQWSISPGVPRKKVEKKEVVVGSGTSARRRRFDSLRTDISRKRAKIRKNKQSHRNLLKGYVKGGSDELLTHAEVVQLSKTIKAGLKLEEHKSRLKERLGCDPTEEQLAAALRMSRSELQLKFMESSFAREKLTMSNIRLVMSIAQRYDHTGTEMGDLIQGGLIGLLRGIEKFDYSKGYKISTYVYWWIRQGVSKAVVRNSRTERLPNHLHERLSLIRNAKAKLEAKGITPSVDKIAKYLNMSQKKVRNATEAVRKVFSLDREAFPSLDGLPGETLHSYIADTNIENSASYTFDQWTLKEELNKLLTSTLKEREQEIIRLYYGLDNECLTWEDISKRIGLSRERVRQVGLVALEKLKHAAKNRRLDALLRQS